MEQKLRIGKIIMQYEIRTRSENTRKFIDSVMPSMIRQLGLTNSRKFVLIEVSKACGDAMGSTTPLPGLDSYVIVLKPRRWDELGVTLAHEMVHVRQMAKGILQMNNGRRYWQGRLVSQRTKYLDQHWRNSMNPDYRIRSPYASQTITARGQVINQLLTDLHAQHEHMIEQALEYSDMQQARDVIAWIKDKS